MSYTDEDTISVGIIFGKVVRNGDYDSKQD